MSQSGMPARSVSSCLCAIALSLCWPQEASVAADSFWTNTASGNFTNPANWFAATVPGMGDNANFTNNTTYTVSWTSDVTNSNAFFNARSGIVTLNISNNTYSLLDRFIVGQNAGATATVTHSSGTLVVTNGLGTGEFVIGQSGKGTYTLAGGTVIADSLTVTNANGTNSTFTFNSGTLTTLRGSTIFRPLNGDFVIGATAGQPATWNILGGTNLFVFNPNTRNLAIGSGAGALGLLVVSGSGTVLTNNGRMLIGNGGAVGSQFIVSNAASAHTDFTSFRTGTTGIVANADSLWSVTGEFRLEGDDTQLTVTNGGKVTVSSLLRMQFARSTVLVTGSNSLLQSGPSGILVGDALGVDNRLIVADGGKLEPVSLFISRISTASNNTVLVTGPGSVITNAGARIGDNGGFHGALIVSNEGAYYSASGGTIYMAFDAPSSGNEIVVTGSNSLLQSTISVGRSGDNNFMTIENGGTVNGRGGTSLLGELAGSASNKVTVTGVGSVWTSNTFVHVGQSGTDNQLIVTNGGRVEGFLASGSVRVGSLTGGSGEVLVTGAGSLLSTPALFVGSNITTFGSGRVVIRDGGTLEANTLVSGFNSSGIISNLAGIYQFTTNNPVITINTANSVVLDSGTISFRNVTNANVFANVVGANSNQLAKIAFLGDNAFRLNNSSNIATVAQNYVFDTGRGATNYTRLELVNGGALWRSATLTIGSGGSLLASNTVGTVAASVVSTGTIQTVNSKLTFASNVVVNGGYISDPSTNVFANTLTLTPSGYLQGGAGDLFQFERNVTLQSTNSSLYDLTTASVLFTNGAGQHTFDLTGSFAIDRGSNFNGIAAVLTNFAIGEFALSAIDTLLLTGAATNALYVGALDFGGLANTNNLTLDVNLYYDSTLAANSYLGTNTYDLAGAGMLIPYPGATVVIPEPSALLLILLASSAMLRRRTRQK